MMPDGLSVGIPTYNQAAFIGETIESLLQQRRAPDEIVVSDHYSTDDTAAVVRSFGSRVRYTMPPPGTSYARQFMFTLAQLKSRWITLLSSDDIAYPNYVEALLKGAARSPNCVLVRAAWQDIDSEGKALTVRHLLSVRAITGPPRNLIEQRLGPKVSFAAFALRRDAWEQTGGVSPHIESIIDWPIWVRMATLGEFVYIPEVIAGYRTGHDGDKYRKRILMWIRDEHRMFVETFPEAAGQMGMHNTEWIQSASRYRFLNYFCEASVKFAPEERADLITAFRPWAESVGEQERMRRFANGEVFSPPLWLRDLVKARLRPVYAKLKQ